MKRIVSVLLVLLLLCSCSSGKETAPILKGIGFSAEMTYFNEAYSFDGEINGKGALTAQMTAPKELEGLKFTLSEGTTLVEYKGLVYSPVEGTMPFSKIIEDFYGAVGLFGAETGSDADGVIKIGEGADEVVLTISPTGLPQKIEMPDERFAVTFYNTKILKE